MSVEPSADPHRAEGFREAKAEELAKLAELMDCPQCVKRGEELQRWLSQAHAHLGSTHKIPNLARSGILGGIVSAHLAYLTTDPLPR